MDLELRFKKILHSQFGVAASLTVSWKHKTSIDGSVSVVKEIGILQSLKGSHRLSFAPFVSELIPVGER